MIRIDNANKLIFSSSLFTQWGTFHKINVSLELNCCKSVGEWQIMAPFPPLIDGIVETDIEIYMRERRYVEFATSLQYEIKGIKVLDTVTGMAHLIQAASLEAWAQLETRSYTSITMGISTGTVKENVLSEASTVDYYKIIVDQAQNWELLGVLVEDINGVGSLIPMVKAFHPDGIYIGYDTITFDLADTNLGDGVYGATVVITQGVDTTTTISGCAFVDNDIKCILVDYLVDNPTSHIYHLYLALKNATYCDECTCTKLCNLYEILYREIYKKNLKTSSITSNGCGCS